MRVPVWLTLGVAVLVCVFGLYRIRLAFRSDEEDERARARKGLYAMGRRTHFLIGVIYLLLGGALVATSFGWSPLGGMFGSSEPSAPASGTAPKARPATRLVPIEPAATTGAPATTNPAPSAAPAQAGDPAPNKTADPPRTEPGKDTAPDRNAPPPDETR
jgi:hypothetical protein